MQEIIEDVVGHCTNTKQYIKVSKSIQGHKPSPKTLLYAQWTACVHVNQFKFSRPTSTGNHCNVTHFIANARSTLESSWTVCLLGRAIYQSLFKKSGSPQNMMSRCPRIYAACLSNDVFFMHHQMTHHCKASCLLKMKDHLYFSQKEQNRIHKQESMLIPYSHVFVLLGHPR